MNNCNFHSTPICFVSVLEDDDRTGVAPLVDIQGPDRLTLVDGAPLTLSCTTSSKYSIFFMELILVSN